MTKNLRRRFMLYPAAVLMLGALCYGGFVYEAKPDVATLVNSAEILAQAGMLDQAIENARRALEQDPDQQYAHVILGYALGATGKTAESVDHYRRAVELTPATQENRPVLRLYYAEALLAAGRAEDAGREARDVLAANPELHQAWILAGRIERSLGHDEEARAAWEVARKAAPEDHVPLLLLAELSKDIGDLDGAESLLSAAVGLKSGGAEAYLRRACLRGTRGDREGAVADTVAAAARNRVLAARRVGSDESLATLRDDPRVASALAAPKREKKMQENT